MFASPLTFRSALVAALLGALGSAGCGEPEPEPADQRALVKTTGDPVHQELAFSQGSAVTVTRSAGAAPEAGGSRHALIVGVSAYRDPAVPPLRFARRDAEAVWDYFVRSTGLDMPRANARILLDDQATREAIEREIGWLNGAAARGDLAIFYFAGHGVVDVARDQVLGNYLLPHDAVVKRREGPLSIEPGSGLALSRLQDLLGRNTARNLLVVLDSCFSGGGAGNFGRVRLDPRQVDQSRAFLDAFEGLGAGRVLLAATLPNQPALELTALGHGLFTYHFLEGMNNDADRDGEVTLSELYRHVSTSVPRRAQGAGFAQTPLLSGRWVGDLRLRTVPRASYQVGLKVDYQQGAKLVGKPEPPPRPDAIERATEVAATVDVWNPPVPLEVYLLRVVRTRGGVRSDRLLPSGENALAPPVTIAEQRPAHHPDGATGATVERIAPGDADAHVVYVAIASDTPIDLRRIEDLEARLRSAAAGVEPESMGAALAALTEGDAALKHAALLYVFARHGRGAR